MIAPGSSGPMLCLLGPIELSNGRRNVALGIRQRAILGYLALRRGVSTPATTIIDDVWGEHSPPHVAKSLTTLVSRLRHHIGPLGWSIDHTGVGYRLTLPDDALDVCVFDAAVRRATFAFERGDLVVAEHALRSGLALWRGDPLEDLFDEPFAPATRATLLERRYRAEDTLVLFLTKAGDASGAISLLRRLSSETPYHEHRWARLGRALAHAGRTHEARSVFREARHLLSSELGVDPGIEFQNAETSLDADVSVPTNVGRGRSTVPLIGRFAESEALDRARRRSEREGPILVVVSGEAGIGKTHLVEALCAVARAQGATVMVGSCDVTRATPLRALLTALESVYDDRVRAELGPTARDVDLLLSASGRVPESRLEFLGRRITRSVVKAFEVIAKRGPVLLVIDDVHWADPLTLASIEHLASSEESSPILVVVTLRTGDPTSDPAASFFAELSRRHVVETVALRPFGQADTRALIETVALDPPSDEVVEAIAQASGGNPLYVTHLTPLLETLGSTDTALETLPAGVVELARVRLAALSEELRTILEVGAVLGERFTVELVAKITATSELTTAARLERLTRTGLLREGSVLDEFQFAHGMIRHVAYTELVAARRCRLHAAAAMSLEPGDDNIIETATHALLGAPVLPRPFIYRLALEGGQTAAARGNLAFAVRLFQGARGATEPDTATDIVARLGLAAVLIALGDRAEGESHQVAALSAARSLDRWDLVADAILVIAQFGALATQGDALTAAASVDEVLDHLPTDDRSRRSRLELWCANALVNVDAQRAASALHIASSLAGDDEQLRRAAALVRLRTMDAAGCSPRDAEQHAMQLHDESVAAGDLATAAMAGALARVSRFAVGALELRDDDEEPLLEIARDARHAEAEYLAFTTTASIALATRPMDQAEEAVNRAGDFGLRHGLSATVVAQLLHLFTIRREQERLGELESLYGLSVDSGVRSTMTCLTAACRLEAGDRETARELLARFVVDDLPSLARDWTHDAALALFADIACDLGDSCGADSMYTRLSTAEGRIVVLSASTAVFGRADRYLGRLATLEGDDGAAIAHFARARELDDRSGCRLWAGWAAHDEALVRVRQGGGTRDGRIRVLLGEASAAARWAGSRRLARAVASVRRT